MDCVCFLHSCIDKFIQGARNSISVNSILFCYNFSELLKLIKCSFKCSLKHDHVLMPSRMYFHSWYGVVISPVAMTCVRPMLIMFASMMGFFASTAQSSDISPAILWKLGLVCWVHWLLKLLVAINHSTWELWLCIWSNDMVKNFFFWPGLNMSLPVQQPCSHELPFGVDCNNGTQATHVRGTQVPLPFDVQLPPVGTHG